jgi:hypothetical protein
MQLKDYPKPYKELYAVHQSFRRLGFSADEIFVSVSNIVGLGTNILCAHLRTQDKEFIYTVAAMGNDIVHREVLDKWTSFATQLGTASEGELETIWKESELGSLSGRFDELGFRLLEKGFRIPALQGTMSG